MRYGFLILAAVGCAHARIAPPIENSLASSTTTNFEMSGDVVDVDPAELVTVPPPTTSVDMTNAEAAAFQSEAVRLQSHSEDRCRRLGVAMQNQLQNVLIFDKAIVRYVSPYTFYGAGYSYQKNGVWTIGVARNFDALNPRTIADETRTLRHEMAHTLGALEKRNGENWSARDYADRCA